MHRRHPLVADALALHARLLVATAEHQHGTQLRLQHEIVLLLDVMPLAAQEQYYNGVVTARRRLAMRERRYA